MYKIAFDGAVSSAELTIMTKVLESFSKVNRNALTNSVEAGSVDYKAVSEVLEKFAKLAVEASRGK